MLSCVLGCSPGLQFLVGVGVVVVAFEVVVGVCEVLDVDVDVDADDGDIRSHFGSSHFGLTWQRKCLSDGPHVRADT